MQHFFNFIYLTVKYLLAPKEPENIYENNGPCDAEGCKKIAAIVH